MAWTPVSISSQIFDITHQYTFNQFNKILTFFLLKQNYFYVKLKIFRQSLKI